MCARDSCFIKSSNLSVTWALQTVIRARGENRIGEVGHLYAARASCVGILQCLCKHVLQATSPETQVYMGNRRSRRTTVGTCGLTKDSPNILAPPP